ncbi:MAG: hypothetical protein ACRDTG_19285 [Pseudonocardiaceae bacterium]
MQRGNEQSRTILDGRRTDDEQTCSLILVHEVGEWWALYPHGVSSFGVRLERAEAVKMAQAILADED